MVELLPVRAPYVGQVGTRCMLHTQVVSSSNAVWSVSRTKHYARSKMVSPTVTYMMATVSTGNSETALNLTGATGKCWIEYPVGTFTLSDAGDFQQLTGLNDYKFTGVTVKKGDVFYLWPYFKIPSGIPFHSWTGEYHTPPEESWNSGTGTPPSDAAALSTIVAPFAFNSNVYPIAIAALTREPSILCVGDSIGDGLTEVVSDINGDVGTVARLVSPRFGYTGFTITGSALNGFSSGPRTLRDQLVARGIFTHLIVQGGHNDIAGGATVAQLVSRKSAIFALYPSLIPVDVTLIPKAASTDNWTTLANQTLDTFGQRFLEANEQIRLGATGAKFFLDFADAIDPGRTGKWPVSLNFNDAAMPNAFVGTGTVSGTTLTISAVTSGSIVRGAPIYGPNIPPSLRVVGFGTGTGGTGTYTVNASVRSTSSGAISIGQLATPDQIHPTALASERASAYLAGQLDKIAA